MSLSMGLFFVNGLLIVVANKPQGIIDCSVSFFYIFSCLFFSWSLILYTGFTPLGLCFIRIFLNRIVHNLSKYALTSYARTTLETDRAVHIPGNVKSFHE